MIIDLKKLVKLEKSFEASQITLIALRNMMDDVIANADKDSISYKTLKSLDLIKEDKKPTQQLNS
jgi:hypothetical protein